MSLFNYVVVPLYSNNFVHLFIFVAETINFVMIVQPVFTCKKKINIINSSRLFTSLEREINNVYKL